MIIPAYIEGKNGVKKISSSGYLVYKKGRFAIVMTANHAVREIRTTIQITILNKIYWTRKQTFLQDTYRDFAMLIVDVDPADVEDVALEETLCDVPLAEGTPITCKGYSDKELTIQEGYVLDPMYSDGGNQTYIETNLKAWKGLSGAAVAVAGQDKVAAMITHLHPETVWGFVKPIGNLAYILSEIVDKNANFKNKATTVEETDKPEDTIGRQRNECLRKLRDEDDSGAKDIAKAIYHYGLDNSLDPQCEWKVIDALLTLLVACPDLVDRDWCMWLAGRIIQLRMESLRKIRDFAVAGMESPLIDVIVYCFSPYVPEFSLHSGINSRTGRLNHLPEEVKNFMLTYLKERITKAKDYPDRTEALFMAGRLGCLFSEKQQEDLIKCGIEVMGRQSGEGWWWGDWLIPRMVHHYGSLFKNPNLQYVLEECAQTSSKDYVIEYGVEIVPVSVSPRAVESGYDMARSLQQDKARDVNNFYIWSYAPFEVTDVGGNRVYLNGDYLPFSSKAEEMFTGLLECPWKFPKLFGGYLIDRIFPNLDDIGKIKAGKIRQEFQKIHETLDDDTHQAFQFIQQIMHAGEITTTI